MLYARSVSSLLLLSACDSYAGPVHIKIDPAIPTAVVQDAMTVWEERTQLNLFVAAVPGDQHVTIEPWRDDACLYEGQPVSGRTEATFSATEPGSMHGTVRLCLRKLTEERALPIVVHELGHVLRLEHHEDPHNVMNAIVPTIWTISDEQIEQIQETTIGE